MRYNNPMNRYTALYRTTESTVTPSQLRTAVENALGASLQLGSYRLGQIAPQGDSLIAAEVAARLAKEALKPLLAAAATESGCILQQIGWGWTVSGHLTFELIDEATGALLHDPLVDEKSQSEPEHDYIYGWPQIAGMVIFLMGAATVILLVLGYLLIPQIAAWVQENLVMFVLGALLYWIILRGIGGPVTPWSYIRSITADESGITIHGLLGTPVSATWGQISELQLVDNRCMLIAADRPLHFPILDKLGMQDRLQLIRTILQRAELLFVGGKVGELTYRRFDA